MSSRTRKIVILTTVLLVVGGPTAFFVVRSHAFQVGYHKRCMQRAWDATYAEPDQKLGNLVGYSLGEEHELYLYHREKLIQMSAVVELKYEFQHISRPSDEGKHFNKFMVSSERPECIDGSSYPNRPGPMQWTIWCYATDKSVWDQLMSSRDTPDYKAIFMK